MKTVLYFEWIRKKEDMIQRTIRLIAMILGLFLSCILIDIVFPDFNSNYMKWPDMLKNLLGIGNWNSHLFLNVWQLVALGYPFYFTYSIMIGIATAITEEDRLETIVYLHNAGVGRRDILIGKTCVWMGYALVQTLVMLVITTLFALVLGTPQAAVHMVEYHVELGLLGILYMSIASFLAACSTGGEVSLDTIIAILVLPCIVSRIPAIMRFFAELLTVTGRQGAIVDRVALWGEKLQVLVIVSPVSWPWIGISIRGIYVGCAFIVAVIMASAAYSIYCHRE